MPLRACFVVLYFNHISHTRACVKSIIDASYDGSLIYCFDNGSLPENYKLMIEEFPGVNHRRLENNSGYSGGSNRALSWAFKSGYDYALFCTNDTVIGADVLEKLPELAGVYKNDLICPRINHFKKDGIDSFSGYFDRTNYSLQHYHSVSLPDRLDASRDYIPGTCFWISKRVFEDLCGMDETYNTYWEDVDFSFRAHQRGYSIYRAFDVEIAHKVGKTCHKKPLYTTYYFQRNRIRFCRKFLSSGERKTARELIGLELNESLARHLENKDDAKAAYYKELFKELSEL